VVPPIVGVPASSIPDVFPSLRLPAHVYRLYHRADTRPAALRRAASAGVSSAGSAFAAYTA
jgi:hypothetical protein